VPRMHRHFLYALLGVLVLGASIGAFYWHYERYAIGLLSSQKLTPEAANAVKHAYASAQIFQRLHPITGAAHAESIILILGSVNEYAEQLLDWTNPDSEAEILKDLHNNQVGISLARWHAQQRKPPTLEAAILYLTQKKSLALSAEPLRGTPLNAYGISARMHSLHRARVQFEETRPTIAASVMQTLVGMHAK